MKKALFALVILVSQISVVHSDFILNHGKVNVAVNYDSFQTAVNNWVSQGMGNEKVRREKIVAGLNQLMTLHHFKNGGTTFSQFQRYLQKPYSPNYRDIYYGLMLASQVGVTQDDVSAICSAAQIVTIAADPLDVILYGIVDKIDNGNLGQLDTALFQSEVNWLTGTDSNKILLADFLNVIESDPEQDCDSILKNLDAAGVAALEGIVKTAVPTWAPSVLDYPSFDKNLNAWIAFKFTDAASKIVAQEEITKQIVNMKNQAVQNGVPFSDFQKQLLQNDPVWGGPALYFTLSKMGTGHSDNLPVPTDALEAIFRCAGLDIANCQPGSVQSIYTSLISHQNGGTAGSQLSQGDIAIYSEIIHYIASYQGKTVNDVIAYMTSVMKTASSFAQQDLLAIMDPEQHPRPYHYGEDIEYFRNDQKLLPLHAEDPQYYREHVIPSLGIGKYLSADNVGH